MNEKNDYYFKLGMVFGMFVIVFLLTYVAQKDLEVDVPECPVVDIPDCNCSVSCPACPVIDFQSLINVTQGIESPLASVDSSFGSFIFDSKCSGTLVKNLMYSVDRGLCRRDQFDGVRSGYSPERCCLNVGGMTFVGCVTAGNSTFADSNNKWIKLGCYK